MSSLSLRDIGEMIAAARRDGRADLRIDADDIAGFDEGELVRDVAVEFYAGDIVGFKIGATSREAQRIVGCDGPFYGPVFAEGRLAPGAPLALRPGILGLECEIAFTLGSDLPERASPYSADDVADAVAGCHPAFEIVARRTRGDGFPTGAMCVADMALNHSFLLGEAAEGWRDADLAATEVRAFVDGEETNLGWGRNALDGPLNALAWLASRRSQEGLGLAAGQVVLTGTCLGVVPLKAGTAVNGDFGFLGELTLAIT